LKKRVKFTQDPGDKVKGFGMTEGRTEPSELSEDRSILVPLFLPPCDKALNLLGSNLRNGGTLEIVIELVRAKKSLFLTTFLGLASVSRVRFVFAVVIHQKFLEIFAAEFRNFGGEDPITVRNLIAVLQKCAVGFLGIIRLGIDELLSCALIEGLIQKLGRDPIALGIPRVALPNLHRVSV
jgi:hypothetical protein